ncbi:hypothetical protein CHUAL_004945 [Chamberlinius hualienensis]
MGMSIMVLYKDCIYRLWFCIVSELVDLLHREISAMENAAVLRFYKCNGRLFRHLNELTSLKWKFGNFNRQYSTSANGRIEPSFGLLFDIDGVIVRGKKLLPFATTAFKKLVGPDKKFRVPTVFVTNAGNMMRHQKAEQLSNWLDVEVIEEQVVMAHSPLRMFKQFHNEHVFVSGQGPTLEIAKCLGFTHVTTIEQLRTAFPTLDAVDHVRRKSVPCSFEQYFPRIGAVVLFGEPVRWETSLQLIIDLLTTNGLPTTALKSIPYPHIPVLACNMDLQWMAEASMPRFGHGAFLVCLENLYKKITGCELIYSALVGKPSEVTYHYAQETVTMIAEMLGIRNSIKRLYAIGDNVNTDIYGANLYNQFLHNQQHVKLSKLHIATNQIGGRVGKILSSDAATQVVSSDIVSCESILVHTGVYDKSFQGTTDHTPRDFLPVEEKLKEPSYVAENVDQAINLIFERERFY